MNRKKKTKKKQRHAVSMVHKNWKVGVCSKPRKSSFLDFEFRICAKLKKLRGFFPGGKYEELAIKKSE